jgi:hypothetical protein
MKKYRVGFDLVCSHDVVVSAKNANEAMSKALERLAPKLKSRKFWRIEWEDETGKHGGRDGKGY